MSKTLEQGDQVVLGEKYREVVHGVEGVATAQCTYLTGCDHVQIEWMKDGEVKTMWVDILLLEASPKKKQAPVLPPKRSGGPQAHPGARGPG